MCFCALTCDFTYNKPSRVVVLSAHSYLYPTFTTGITVSGITGCVQFLWLDNIGVLNEEAAENDQA